MRGNTMNLLALACLFAITHVFGQQAPSVYFPQGGVGENFSVRGKQQQAKELYQLGYQRYLVQHYSKALELLDEALLLQPTFSDAYMLRGNTKERLDDLAGALVDYEIVLHLRPDYTEARFNRAFTLYKHKRYEQALAGFQYLLEHPSPGETQAVYFKGVSIGDGQGTAFTDVMTLQSDIQSDLYYYMGLCYKEMDSLYAALDYFNLAITHHPNVPELYINRALVYEAAGEADKAVADYKKTLELDPANVTAANNLTALAATTREDRQVLQAFDKAIAKDPWAYTTYLNRGILKQQQGKYAEAILDFDEALTLSPNHPDILIQRAFTQEKLENLAGALSDYTKALTYERSDATLFLNRGNVYFKQEAFERAIADYDRALRLDKENAKIYYNRALAYHKIGMKENACQDLEKALQLEFESAEKVMQAFCQ